MRAAQELRELLSQDGFARPLRLAREKVEAQGDIAGTISLPAVSPEELRCLTGVLGRRWQAPVAGQDVPGLALRRLDGALRDSRFACTLSEALELLADRPLHNRRAARAALRDGREAVWARASAHPAAAAPRTAAWLKRARSTGAIARLAYADGGDALTACLDAAAALPAEPPEALAVLAARLHGSAHALDPDRPAGQLLVSLLAAWRRRPAPSGAAQRRALLAEVGVLSDPISCAVAALNLPATGDGLVAGMTSLAAGRHLSFTLGNLVSEPLALRTADVFICENPTVLAEAERSLGAAAPPLVCTDGQFNTACLRLLEALGAAGCALHVHADFDWGGLNIVSRAIQTAGARPWRYDLESYREALQRVPATSPSSRPAHQLDGRLAPLAAELRAGGRAIHEEALIELLLDDLRRAASTRDTDPPVGPKVSAVPPTLMSASRKGSWPA
jgi:uncharacterized protein (TIGR02679 family)